MFDLTTRTSSPRTKSTPSITPTTWRSISTASTQKHGNVTLGFSAYRDNVTGFGMFTKPVWVLPDEPVCFPWLPARRGGEVNNLHGHRGHILRQQHWVLCGIPLSGAVWQPQLPPHRRIRVRLSTQRHLSIWPHNGRSSVALEYDWIRDVLEEKTNLHLLKYSLSFNWDVFITEHKTDIRTGDEKSPVAKHFNVVRQDVCQMTFNGLEVVQPFKRGGDREKLLLQRETFYINVLQTQIPRGFNEELLSATGALFLYIILHLKLSKRCRSLPPQRIRWCKTFLHLSWKKISVSMFFFLSSGICLLIYKHLSWSSQNTSFYNQEVKPDNTKYKEETIEKT